MRVARLGRVAVVLLSLAAPVAADEPWTLTHGVDLLSKPPRGARLIEERITADLYRPKIERRMPAAVIINSSGGVSAQTEHHYARALAEAGVAALVVDSFAPRGVRETMSDQRQVRQSQSAADAVAGFRWLAGQQWVDATRIVVLGMSRGGTAALDTAVLSYLDFLQARDVRFAAHVAISPACMVQNENARTTGAPIFYQLSELDDLDPIQPCLEYLERMRSAGNDKLRLAIYPGVHHGKESIGGIATITSTHTPNCRLFLTAARRLIDRRNGRPVPAGKESDYVYETCATPGPFAVGGDPRVKAQATSDLLQFLRDVDIVEDGEARAAAPDCASISEAGLRRNCVRARAGWTGDMVALGRAYRAARLVARDDGAAARLFALAAQRGHPHAQWELALMHRDGEGVEKDLARALLLLRAAAEAGYPTALNTMGVWARDGVGRARDDAEAVRWFRAAADLLNDYAMDHLGIMYRQGRGGLGIDHHEAVRRFQAAAFRGNPWGRLHLAEAFERGEGIERDVSRAAELYRAVAAQEQDANAKRRAVEGLTRLGAGAPAR